MERKIWYLKNADLFSWMGPAEIEQMARRHPDFAFRIIKLIRLRFRAMESRIEDLAFQNVHDRLIFVLGSLARKHGVLEKSGVIRLPVTQANLAFLIGATREAVADQLKELRREGLVETSYRSIQLMKPDAIRARQARRDPPG
jgi:CRP/FNR family transcriptional regulator